MTATEKARELSGKLFALVNEFTDFALSVHNSRTRREDAQAEAYGQIDAVKCQLAAVYDRISGPSADYPLFTDYGQDEPEYGFNLPDGMADDLPAKLASLIEATGLSVTAFCKAHDLSQQTVQGYVSGARRPTWDMVQQLAKALGVPTDTFRDR